MNGVTATCIGQHQHRGYQRDQAPDRGQYQPAPGGQAEVPLGSLADLIQPSHLPRNDHQPA